MTAEHNSTIPRHDASGLCRTYKAKLFINHDKAQSDTLKLLPAFYD
jgi:hypothetical protein